MATIGSITVAFGADLRGLSDGIDEAVRSLGSVSDRVEEISSQVAGLSGQTIRLSVEVDSSAIDEIQDRVEETTATIGVTADVEDLTDTIEEEVNDTVADLSETAEVRFGADVTAVVTAAATAANAVEPLRNGFVIPITASTTAITAARNGVNSVREAFAAAASAAAGFSAAVRGTGNTNGVIGSSVVLTASLVRAWTSSVEAFESSTTAARTLSVAINALSRSGSSQERLNRAITEGGSAFVGVAAGAALGAAATRGVEQATEGLNPRLRESTRQLAGLLIAYGQTQVAASVATASVRGISAAINSSVNPLAAVTAFMQTYRRGLDAMAISAVAANDRQRVFVRAVDLVQIATRSLRGSAEGVFDPFVKGFTRARESGDGYFAALSRGVRGQINSIGILRRASESLADAFKPFATGFSRARAEGLSFFAAFDRGFTGQLQSISVFRTAVDSIGGVLNATGVSSFFEPLITGFTRARAAGQGFIQATARGLSGQINSSSAYRATRDAVVSLGEALVAAGGKIIGYRASTEAGRKAFSLFRASLDAIRSSASEAIQYLGVLRQSVAAAVQALPGGRALVEAFAEGWRGLSSASVRVASDTTLLSGAIRAAANAMTFAAVAGGAYADELRHMGEEARTTRNMSDRFGATTQEIEKLRFAADSAGVGLNQLAKGQQQLFTSLSKIRVGQINTDNVREAKLAFDKLGISIEDLKTKSPNEVFEEIAKKITAIKDPADRTAIAFDLFGKQGAAILPALKSLGQIEKDVERLDVTTNKLEFSRIEAVGASFNRLRRATTSYAEASATAFTELQAGFNNFLADFLGGLATLVQYSGSLYADTTKPLAVLLEVTGRVVNILLRAAGAVVKFASAFSLFPAVARFAQAVGEKIKEVLEVLEEGVSKADEFANAVYNALTPDYWTGAIEGGKNLNQQILATAQTLGLTIVSAGAAKAAMELAGIQPGRAFRALAAMIRLPELSFRGLATAAISAFRALTVGITQTLINYTAAAIKIIAVNAQMGVAAIIKWITPSLSGMISYVTGIRAVEVATRIMAVRMAASWVIASAGLALIPILAVAVYENFDRLSSYFASFASNVAKLFTFEGAADAAKAVAGAIWNAFKSILSNIGGFVGSVVRAIVSQFESIKPPPEIDAARASVKEVVFQRQKVAEVQFQQQQAVEKRFGAMGLGPSPAPVAMPPAEDTEALEKSLASARGEMDRLIIESSRFGDASGKAAEEATLQFSKLQQQFSKRLISPKEFEDQAKAISATLRKNLVYFSQENAVESLKKNREFFKSLNDLTKQAAKDARDASAGMVVGNTLFPSSDEIKKQADAALSQYAAELERIAQLKQSGALGSGPTADAAASIAVEEAQRRQKQRMDKIGRDTSFAEEIRKNLETAFLSPLGQYEKRLKEIQGNKSLTPAEKSLATVAEQKQLVESTFGKTEGQGFKDRQELIDKLSTKDEFGRVALSPERAGVEQRKLDADRRSAAGVENTPAQQLQLGIDKINSAFDATGKSMAQIQKDLGPEKFKEYQEALRKNRDSVLQSVGIEKSAVQVREEANRRLQGLSLSAGDAAQAQRKISDSFMSALGITKTPFEQFSGELDNIAEQFKMAGKPLDEVRESLKGNAKDLELFDRAVKQSRDNLLASLGVKKTPQQIFDEKMKQIDEAENNKDPNKPSLTKEEATKARIAVAREREQSLGADTAKTRAGQFAERRREIEEAFGKNGEKNQEAFDSAMKNLKKQGPGAEPESPVAQFKESLKELEYMKGSGAISKEEFSQRKLNLQAELQESLKPALDNLKPDRRGVEGSDVRSKAGVDTFFRILRGNDNPSLKAQLEIARNTKFLAEAAREPDAAPLIAQLPAR